MRARYGASPLHLLAHLAALALAAWALLQALQLGGADRIALWLIGAVVLHDALLWPAYTTLDRLARRGRPAGWANYVRVPRRDLGAAAARLLPGHVRQGRAHVHARERRDVGGLRGPLAARERGAVRRPRARSTSSARAPGSSS